MHQCSEVIHLCQFAAYGNVVFFFFFPFLQALQGGRWGRGEAEIIISQVEKLSNFIISIVFT